MDDGMCVDWIVLLVFSFVPIAPSFHNDVVVASVVRHAPCGLPDVIVTTICVVDHERHEAWGQALGLGGLRGLVLLWFC